MMGTMPQWETIERPDGSFDILTPPDGAEQERTQPPVVLGHARITELGWIAEAANGYTYGPFTSLSEAAYPLALASEGQEQDARLLLGRPIPPDGIRSRRVPPPAAPPVRRNRDRLIRLALLAVAVVAVIADRRTRSR